MSDNCILCVVNKRTDIDLLCNECRLRQMFRKEAACRTYYQRIVYSVCNTLDAISGAKPGQGIVCGTLEHPNDNVQTAMAGIARRLQLLEGIVAPDAQWQADAAYKIWQTECGNNNQTMMAVIAEALRTAIEHGEGR